MVVFLVRVALAAAAIMGLSGCEKNFLANSPSPSQPQIASADTDQSPVQTLPVAPPNTHVRMLVSCLSGANKPGTGRESGHSTMLSRTIAFSGVSDDETAKKAIKKSLLNTTYYADNVLHVLNFDAERVRHHFLKSEVVDATCLELVLDQLRFPDRSVGTIHSEIERHQLAADYKALLDAMRQNYADATRFANDELARRGHPRSPPGGTVPSDPNQHRNSVLGSASSEE